jgi:predicted GNAT superfamily acetyltransferase
VIEVRQLTQLAEFRAAVQLQKLVWGFADIELLPLRLFVVAHKVGGHSFGAYDGRRMVAFLIAIPGIKPGGAGYLHSHMLGVLPGYRDRGLGRRLKLAQREEALARGITLIEWTFDPLEIKNAYFNLESLGAIARRYVVNQYGTTTSPLHGRLPTDRCVAEWWLEKARTGRGEVTERVAVPAEIETLRHEEPRRARRIQQRVSEGLRDAFARGLAVVGFERSATEGIYLLGPWK